ELTDDDSHARSAINRGESNLTLGARDTSNLIDAGKVILAHEDSTLACSLVGGRPIQHTLLLLVTSNRVHFDSPCFVSCGLVSSHTILLFHKTCQAGECGRY